MTTSNRTWTRPDKAREHVLINDIMRNKVHIEVTYKSKSSIPCVYMEEAVKEILPAYDRQVTYSRLDIQSQEGKQRFLALSCSLFGEKGVYEHHRLAPIPAVFMDGELGFMSDCTDLERLDEALIAGGPKK